MSLDKKILYSVLSIIVIFLGIFSPNIYNGIIDHLFFKINEPTEMNLHIVNVESKKCNVPITKWDCGYNIKTRIINNGAAGNAIIRCNMIWENNDIVDFREDTFYFKLNEDKENIEFYFEPKEIYQYNSYYFNVSII